MKLEEKPNDRAYDMVLTFIKQQIQEKKLKLGDKLPSERKMMMELGLGRNSVREALRQLENMGFIRSVHGQGNFLINEAGEGISEIFSMLTLLGQTSLQEFLVLRESIESASFALAIERNIPLEELEKMNLAVRKMKGAASQNMMEEAEKEFHEVLIKMSGNFLFIMIMDALASLGDTYRREAMERVESKNWMRLTSVHEEILNALKNGEKEKGLVAIKEHFLLI